MSFRSRETKVLAALLVSIAAGATILTALGNNPPSAGAFCLSRYYGLDPVEKFILSHVVQPPGRWSRVEIYYSGTKTGNPPKADDPDKRIEQPASLSEPGGPEYMNCHFVICDGRIGFDGQIQPTKKWQRQQSITPAQNYNDEPALRFFSKTPTNRSEQTIYICVIADGKAARPVRNSTVGNIIQKGKISNGARPTDLQIKRTEALVEGLCRKFNIQPESIHYPNDWQ